MNQRFTYTILPLSIPSADIYTFSAKEKDPETGLSYFGSRYYSSDLSVWLSVDPMSDKYPSFSPYVYCADNPVKLVDPNGEEIYVEIDGVKYEYNGHGLVDKDGIEIVLKENTFGGRTLKDLNTLYNSKSSLIQGKMKDLIKSKHKHTIKLTSDGTDYNHTLNKADASIPGKGSGTVTYYNPFSTKNNCVDGDRLSCAVLAHELLGHGWNKDQGVYDNTSMTSNGIRYEEINAINLQNIVLKEHNLQTRTAIGHDEETRIAIPDSDLNHYFTPKPTK
jgi:RHS repeat-associated protein